jgi:hypothetical protein
MVGSGVGEDYHMRWFQQHLPGDESVEIRTRKLYWGLMHNISARLQQIVKT